MITAAGPAAAAAVDSWTPTAGLIAGIIAALTALFNVFGPGLARKWFGTAPDVAAANATRNVKTIETTLKRTLDLVDTKMVGVDDKLTSMGRQLDVLLDRLPRTPAGSTPTISSTSRQED